MLANNIGSRSATEIKINRNPLNETGSFWGLLKLTAPTNEYKLRNFSKVIKPLTKIGLAKVINSPIFYGALFAKKNNADGTVEDYGLVSLKLVTTAGVRAVTDHMANTTTDLLNDFSWHAIGIGTVDPDASDTTLGSEVESRVEDTTSRTSTSSGDDYRYSTSAEVTASAAVAVTEHGLLSSNAGGTLFDRSEFAVINLSSGDSLTTTYQVTFQSGS